MKKVFFSALTLILGVGIVAAQTADEIIAKHIAATGGDNWKKVEAVRMEGNVTAEAAPGMAIGWSMVALRDKAIRMDISVMGMTQVMAAKGEQGWTINPFTGGSDPEPMTADQVKSLIEQADIDGAAVGYEEKGYNVEYLGTEDVDGTLAHKIKIDKGNKNIEYVFYDPNSFYEIKTIEVEEVDGQEMESTTLYSDFREVMGIIVPYSMQQTNPMMGNTTISLTKVEFNPTLSLDFFDPPKK